MKKRMLSWILAALLLIGCASSGDAFPGSATEPEAEIPAAEDSDMYDTLITRFMGADPAALNQKQLTVAALITFEAEMMNGGLCQFFVNDYPGYAQYISDALEEVGATEMLTLYSDFIIQNKIDVAQMEDFRILSIQDYTKQLARFPYDAFDNAFYEIYQRENLSDLLLSYVQLHAEEVLG